MKIQISALLLILKTHQTSVQQSISSAADSVIGVISGTFE